MSSRFLIFSEDVLVALDLVSGNQQESALTATIYPAIGAENGEANKQHPKRPENSEVAPDVVDRVRKGAEILLSSDACGTCSSTSDPSASLVGKICIGCAVGDEVIGDTWDYIAGEFVSKNRRKTIGKRVYPVNPVRC